MNEALAETKLTTADLVAAAETPTAKQKINPAPHEPAIERTDSTVNRQAEQLAPLFLADAAIDFRSRWDAVQIGFVDDPRQAVQKADELVAQVMKSLAETFASERAKIEGQFNEKDDATTENLRVALRRYRSFFQRLLSL
jgi:hypothetical protein